MRDLIDHCEFDTIYHEHLCYFSVTALDRLFRRHNGLETPMLVILIGAIGGAIAMGIVGLFIGAVILALGYELLVTWMAPDDPEAEAETG